MYDLEPTSAEAAAIRAVILAAKPARKELQRLAKLCGIKANQKSTVILEELEKLVAAEPAPVAAAPEPVVIHYLLDVRRRINSGVSDGERIGAPEP